MPIEIPDLDDRTFADLTEEALALLPRYAPVWTNYNPSDPGITLIEVLAYFTEMLIYRLNRVSRENKIQFLQLLRGPERDWQDQKDWRERLARASSDEVDEELRRTVLELRQPQRAVTREDFEYLARRATANEPSTRKVARTHCASRRNLAAERSLRDEDRPGHVSVVVVPERPLEPDDFESLLDQVRTYLAPKCLLTTRLHVVAPCYVWVSLRIRVCPRVGVAFGDIRERIVSELDEHFGPYPGGGPNGEGWPFGRSVYLGEILDILQRLPIIVRVEEIRVLQLSIDQKSLHDRRAAVGVQIGSRSTLGIDSRLGAEAAAGGGRLLRNDIGQLIGIGLKPYELVRIVVPEEELHTSSTGSGQMVRDVMEFDDVD